MKDTTGSYTLEDPARGFRFNEEEGEGVAVDAIVVCAAGAAFTGAAAAAPAGGWADERHEVDEFKAGTTR